MSFTDFFSRCLHYYKVIAVASFTVVFLLMLIVGGEVKVRVRWYRVKNFLCRAKRFWQGS